MNRSSRRKAENKAFKQAQKIKKTQAFEIVNAIKTLRDQGAIKINYNTYEVQLLRKLMWDDRGEDWQKNFTSRLHAYLDGITGKDPDAPDYKPITLTISDLTTRDLLTTFKPEL